MPEVNVIVVSMTGLLKRAHVVDRLGKGIEHLDIQEITVQEASKLVEEKNAVKDTPNNFSFILDRVEYLDPDKHIVRTTKGNTISYRFVCICTGARPRVIEGDKQFILGLRDTSSVQQLSLRLKNSRKVIIVGNGGIATELVQELNDCSVVWVMKDKSISSTFFDAAAAKFLLDSRKHDNCHDKLSHGHSNKSTVCTDKPCDTKNTEHSRRKGVLSTKYLCDNKANKDTSQETWMGEGSALGPDWAFMSNLRGASHGTANTLEIEFETTISQVLSRDAFLTEHDDMKEALSHDDMPAVVLLSNGKVLTCDLVLSATGVIPNTQLFFLPNESSSRFIMSSNDGGVLVR